MLKLYKPKLNELNYRQSLLLDGETMSYNKKWGGTINFQNDSWKSWYEKWVLSDEREYYYRYLYSDNVQGFVGEVAYRYDRDYQAHVVNIIIAAKYRGLGYGKEGLLALIEAARKNGIAKLCDDIAIDNPSISLFLNIGFAEVSRNDDCVIVELVL